MPRIFTIIAIIRVWGKSELGERSSTDLWTCWKRKIAGFLQDYLASLIEIVILDSPPSWKSIFFFSLIRRSNFGTSCSIALHLYCCQKNSFLLAFLPSFRGSRNYIIFIFDLYLSYIYSYIFFYLFILISYIYITLYYIWSIIKITVAWKDKKDTCEFFFYLSEK